MRRISAGGRDVEYDPTGAYFASIEGESHSVFVRDATSGAVISNFGGLADTETPLKVNFLTFSPRGTYVLTWARPMPGVSVANLVVYKAATGERMAAFFQKVFHKDFWPTVQWSDDESIAVRAVTNTLHFFPGDKLGQAPTSKIGIPGVTKCELSRGSAPYTVAVFISGAAGSPGKFALYRHPDQGGEQILHRSTFRADSVTFKWNSRGSSLLALISTNVDTSGKSYYGESEVYFMTRNGTVNKRVDLPQEGPTYDAAWSPSGDHFIIIYGFMPARATMFDARCDPVFNFGTGSWNTIVFSPHGRYVALAGFGNLAGRVEFWDTLETSLVGRCVLPCTTAYSWSPCSHYFLGATSFPRLRVDNGFRIVRFDGKQIHFHDLKESLLYQAEFRPSVSKAYPDPKTTAAQMIGGPPEKPGSRNSLSASGNGAKSGGVYRPPGSRGAAASFSLHEHVKAGKVDKADFLSGKVKLAANPKAAANGKKIVPGMDPDEVAEKGPSKSALKRKKRKEKLAQLEKESGGAAAVGNAVSGSEAEQKTSVQITLPEFSNVAAAEKRVKALNKKLRQIATLKEMQGDGKELNDEQRTKVESEGTIQMEMKAVQDLIALGTLAM